MAIYTADQFATMVETRSKALAMLNDALTRATAACAELESKRETAVRDGDVTAAADAIQALTRAEAERDAAARCIEAATTKGNPFTNADVLESAGAAVEKGAKEVNNAADKLGAAMGKALDAYINLCKAKNRAQLVERDNILAYYVAPEGKLDMGANYHRFVNGTHIPKAADMAKAFRACGLLDADNLIWDECAKVADDNAAAM